MPNICNVLPDVPDLRDRLYNPTLRPLWPYWNKTPLNRDDQASEWHGKVEMTPEFLAEFESKARQKGISLFAYLTDFVIQDDDDSPTTRSRSRFE
jgi:hypothetical protein